MKKYKIYYETRGMWDHEYIEAHSILDAIDNFYRKIGFYEITQIEPG